jgi:hypothetical protein
MESSLQQQHPLVAFTPVPEKHFTLAPQWKNLPVYQSRLLKDLIANHFPAVVPTHLYSSKARKAEK